MYFIESKLKNTMKFHLGFILLLNTFRASLSFVIQKPPAVIVKPNFSVADTPVLLGNISLFPPACPSQIYCYGKLLDTVQMSKIYKDSKTFVDMRLKKTPNETITKFHDLIKTHGDNLEPQIIKDFVEGFFAEPGDELIEWTPSDWKERPRFLDLIRDPDLRQWGSDLNNLWKMLGRRMVDDVGKNPEHYSIIHVDHPIIIPGGRFREFYYWDSYWIIRGLLYSEMYDTARGMLSNFLSIIERYGFIPNGGRIYYSKRSQPPLLAAMIKAYVEETGDEKFAINSVKTLEHEFQFWMNNHTLEVKGHFLATYGDKSSGPRPESYREDILTSEAFDNEEEKQEHYSELKAAAESGMDFTSRWFINSNGTNEGSLKDTKTRSIIPVELNAFLFWNANIIAEFYAKAGDLVKAAEYQKKAREIYDAIHAVLWQEDIGCWLDYDIINNKRREYFTPTNLSPLWVKCYDIANSETIANHVLRYINETGIDNYPGGVPNTLYRTGEQWDFPNVWPPMQYMLIMGLHNLGTEDTRSLALKWATRWIQSNFEAYKDSRSMFEKYDAEIFGGHGGGGEYDIQLGFGWTNGVIIELLAKYGHIVTPASASSSGNRKSYVNKYIFGGAITSIVVLLAVTVGRFIW